VKAYILFLTGFKTFITKEEIKKEVEPDDEIIIPCPISDPEESQLIILRELLQLNVHQLLFLLF
jgi:hypothetical protein